MTTGDRTGESDHDDRRSERNRVMTTGDEGSVERLEPVSFMVRVMPDGEFRREGVL